MIKHVHADSTLHTVPDDKNSKSLPAKYSANPQDYFIFKSSMKKKDRSSRFCLVCITQVCIIKCHRHIALWGLYICVWNSNHALQTNRVSHVLLQELGEEKYWICFSSQIIRLNCHHISLHSSFELENIEMWTVISEVWNQDEFHWSTQNPWYQIIEENNWQYNQYLTWGVIYRLCYIWSVQQLGDTELVWDTVLWSHSGIDPS